MTTEQTSDPTLWRYPSLWSSNRTIHLRNLERELQTIREAVGLVVENYSSISCGTREPICITLKRRENELKVFSLVVSLNNLKRKYESTTAHTPTGKEK